MKSEQALALYKEKYPAEDEAIAVLESLVADLEDLLREGAE